MPAASKGRSRGGKAKAKAPTTLAVDTSALEEWPRIDESCLQVVDNDTVEASKAAPKENEVPSVSMAPSTNVCQEIEGVTEPPPSAISDTCAATSIKTEETSEIFTAEETEQMLEASRDFVSDGEVRTTNGSTTGNTQEADINRVLDPSVVNALREPRQRNFLLKLESHIIANLRNDKIERIKLTTPIPPYYRFLVHLLADYFGLTRHVDQAGDKSKATMTLFRTDTTCIPMRTLASICDEESQRMADNVDALRAGNASTSNSSEVTPAVVAMPLDMHAVQHQAPPNTTAKAPSIVDRLPGPPPVSVEEAAALAASIAAPQVQPTDTSAPPSAPPKSMRVLKKDGHGRGSLPPVEEEDCEEEFIESFDDDAWDGDLAPPARFGSICTPEMRAGSASPPVVEEEDAEDDEDVAPVPVVIPGKVKIMKRREGDEESSRILKNNDDDGKKDLSKLPFEEREQVYQQTRARIFGENEKMEGSAELTEESSISAIPPDSKSEQRRQQEIRLAQDRMNDMKDPAYNRNLSCNLPNPYSGRAGQVSYNAAPSDASNDPRAKALEAAQAQVLAAQRAQAVLAQSGIYNPGLAPGSWRAPNSTGMESPRPPTTMPAPAAPSLQQLAQLQFLQQQLQIRAPQMTAQQFNQAQLQLQLQMQQYQQQQMLFSQQRPPFPVGLQQNQPRPMN